MATHAETAHAWAHQTGKQRNAGRVFYHGDTIYSYGSHFPIARHVTLPNGNPAVLFTTRGYSSSTSKHKRLVEGACRHLDVYYVERPGNLPTVDDFDARIVQATECVAKAKRARKYGDHHLAAANSHIREANRLLEAFNLDRNPASLDTLTADMADIRERIEAANRAEREQRAAAAEERFRRNAERREAWLAGGDGYYHDRDPHTGSALLRVVGDELQTSLGASVPLSHAVRVFGKVYQCRLNRTGWVCNGHTLHVGHFQVDRIEPTGDFHAGCHFIAWSECERIAITLGLFAEPQPA